MTTPRPLRGYDETRGCRPQNDTGLFIETPFSALCEEQMHYNDDDDGRRADEQPGAGRARNENELTRLTAMICAEQTTTKTMARSVGGRIGIL